MTAINPSDFLERHGVKATSNRLLVVKALEDAGRPLSLTELENALETVDKSGIFRCLEIFKEHHLVHQIDDGSVRYELCRSLDCDHDEDTHTHFYCEVCHKTFCLEDIPVPHVSLGSDYSVHSASYVIKGVCPDCQKKG